MPVSRLRRAPRAGLTLLAAGLAFALAVVMPAPSARAQSAMSPEQEAWARSIKQEQRRMLMAGPLRHLKAASTYAKAVARAQKKHQPLPKKGVGLKHPPTDLPDLPFAPAPGATFGAQQALSIPTNVQANNVAGDAAGAGQSEEMIASLGQFVLVAWNDGQGFSSPPDVQGYGYSLDGGATFTDGGFVPRANAAAAWTSDPVVTVNEKTGEFFYCGLYDPDGTHSGVAVKKATFSPSGITWSPEVVANSVDNTQFFIDKQWLVADSSSGDLYLTYTKFTVADDSIMFQRSTDGGATWSAPIVLSDPATAGFQQGSRPTVGPNGEVYAVWSELGPVDKDFAMLRKSTDHGVSFAPQVTAASMYNNFGTGAPGFNRERSVDFPSIVVDRTTGPFRGRVYLTWHESVNWFDDPVGTVTPARVETEPNSGTGSASAFTPGQTLRGSLTTSDVDFYSWAATQGTTYIFAVDSIPRPLYTARVMGPDGTTRLQFGGQLSLPAGGSSFLVFTAPTTATYYLRLGFQTGGSTGGYRIRTGVDAHGIEPSRDERDVMVAHSDDGALWSAGVRVNDDPAWFDDWLPEVGIGADGMPYSMWFDWRDGTYGGSSNVYVARSTDGGTTWQPSQRVSSVTTPWTTVSTNIAPNQGDYSSIYGDNRWVRPSWADGRNGTPDVFTTAIDTWFAVAGCQPDTALNRLDVLNGGVMLTNQSPLFANDYTVQAIPRRSWPSTATPATVASGATAPVTWSLTVPDTAAAGVCVVDVVARNATGTLVRTCTFNLTVNSTASAGPSAAVFSLAQNSPNPTHGQPTRIAFSLPASGTVRLEVFSVGGQRVRTLIDGARSAGPNVVVWDGNDDHGRPVRAGAYFYRLTAGARSAVRRMVVLQ